ncbi:hypothetical protein GCM10027614_51340 [Micromonospora vulcania]
MGAQGASDERRTPYGTMTESRRGLRAAARLAVLALILWAIVDVLRTVTAVGYYEHRIEIATHGNVDVVPAWLAYLIVSELTPRAS